MISFAFESERPSRMTISSPKYLGITSDPNVQVISSSALSNVSSFFSLPTHASVYHFFSPCVFVANISAYVPLDAALCNVKLRAAAIPPFSFWPCPCLPLSAMSLLCIAFALPYFGKFRYIFSPPMIILSSCFSNLFLSDTPLNLTNPYLQPLLFLCLDMKTSLTSPHSLN
ncbi:hypothetical protein AAZV13_15G229900 [Glycine max]